MWSVEDGGPTRNQLVTGGLFIRQGEKLRVDSRVAPAITMAVGRGSDSLYVLRHSAGQDAFALVEKIDPISLESLQSSVELEGGPTWPGSLGIHENGSLYEVFGNHAHRLDEGLDVVASAKLPLESPYNGFIILPDGHLVTKNFAGSLPGKAIPPNDRQECELIVLEPDSLDMVASLKVGEPSVARLSSFGNEIYVVGDSSLIKVAWNGSQLRRNDTFSARYLISEGGGYGWDCVIGGGFAWFLDDGDGTERYDGTLRGKGSATAPLHLVRIDLQTASIARAEICGQPGGLVANPPVIDVERSIVVGYDSGNGIISAFDLIDLEPIWHREQDHASHFLLYQESGELVTGDGPDVLVLDIQTGSELARAPLGDGTQSVLFPAPGFSRDFYVCTFMSISRVSVS